MRGRGTGASPPARGPRRVRLAFTTKPCYDRPMRAFVGVVDSAGLRRLIPEDQIPGDALRRLARGLSLPTRTVVWALLAEGDADDLRAALGAGRHAEACGLLLNRAVELVGLGSVAPLTSSFPA